MLFGNVMPLRRYQFQGSTKLDRLQLLQSLFRLGIGGWSSSLSSSSWSSRTDIGPSRRWVPTRYPASTVAADLQTATRETMASYYLPSVGVVEIGGFS